MRKLFLLFLIAAVGGGWFFLQKYRIEGLDRFAIKPRLADGTVAEDASGQTVARAGGTIRIASWEVAHFDLAKLGKPQVLKSLVDVIRRFDVVAVQGIVEPRDDLLPRFVEELNAGGRHYDYIIGPRMSRAPGGEQLAFLYDAASIDVDRTAVYTVDDPGKVFRRDPLAASFSVRGLSPAEAFTFTLVNVRVEPDRNHTELDALADVYRAVRGDGRDEDDVIVLGDLSADDHHLGLIGQLPLMTAALSGTPTATRGTKMLDNILFNRQATIEFTARAGVLDLLHDLHLTMAQALDVSDHLPIWAEFSIYEGGQPGRLAAQMR